jgi:hypothetical protein
MKSSSFLASLLLIAVIVGLFDMVSAPRSVCCQHSSHCSRLALLFTVASRLTCWPVSIHIHRTVPISPCPPPSRLKLQATAVTIDDFTKLNTTGGCADSKGNAFTVAVSDIKSYTNDMAMLNYCLSWCGQWVKQVLLSFNRSLLTNKLASCPKEPPNHLSWIRNLSSSSTSHTLRLHLQVWPTYFYYRRSLPLQLHASHFKGCGWLWYRSNHWNDSLGWQPVLQV